jgi:hypothetical protein
LEEPDVSIFRIVKEEKVALCRGGGIKAILEVSQQGG